MSEKNNTDSICELLDEKQIVLLYFMVLDFMLVVDKK